MGCVLLSIGIVFCQNASQEDNTPLSLFTHNIVPWLTNFNPDIYRSFNVSALPEPEGASAVVSGKRIPCCGCLMAKVLTTP
jgi:hypothetical protein